jgi:hypothetical protein
MVMSTQFDLGVGGVGPSRRGRGWGCSRGGRGRGRSRPGRAAPRERQTRERETGVRKVREEIRLRRGLK